MSEETTTAKLEGDTSLTVPDVYRGIVEDLRLLQRDGQNPTR